MDELKQGAPHPSANFALKWILDNYSIQDLMFQLEAFSSCAIEGNDLACICGETLRRIMHNEPVSDRYLLGLAWYLAKQKGIKANEE